MKVIFKSTKKENKCLAPLEREAVGVINQTALSNRENLKVIISMEKANYNTQMVAFMKASGAMI